MLVRSLGKVSRAAAELHQGRTTKGSVLMAHKRLEMVSRHVTDSSSKGESASSNSQDPVLFESKGALRKMILNRPKALNSLNDDMIDLMLPKLQKWEQSDSAKVVLFKGNGNSFCAGGDVRALIGNLAADKDRSEWQKSPDFFRREYETDAFIANMKTPVVSIMHGNTMGGGVGLSVHAPFRIATESTVVAMPETKIGLFPDVGASFFLSRLDGQLGVYLGLTSEAIKGVGAYYSGFASHFVPQERLHLLEERLADVDLSQSSHEAVNAVINEYAADSQELERSGSFDLVGVKRRAIDVIFARKTAEDIVAGLEALEQDKLDLRAIIKSEQDKSQLDDLKAWAKKVRNIIEFKSPTSVKLALAAIRNGARLDIDQTFVQDLRIATGCCNPEIHPDFREGVTHVLVKKDNKTRANWQPASLPEVSDRAIQDNFFRTPAPFELPAVPKLDFSSPSSSSTGAAAAPTRKAYKSYPYRKYSLPTEKDIRDVVTGDAVGSGDKALTKDEVLRAVEREWDGKQGVRQKVEEVLARKCKSDDAGYLKWVA